MKSKAQLQLKQLAIREAVIVRRDGFVIEQVGDMDPETVGTTVATVLGAAQSMGSEFGQGALFAATAEYDGGTIIVVPIGSDVVLGLALEPSANLGAVRDAVKKGLGGLTDLPGVSDDGATAD